MNFIKDPVLDPYFIQVDDLNYSAYKTIIPDSGKSYDSCVGHFKNLSTALERIAEHQVRQKSYDTLKEYIEELKSIKNELKTIV